MSEVDFSEEGVLEDARQSAGLADFGPDDFRAGLRMLLETYDKNAFTERGRRRNRRRIVGLLATRLRIQAALNTHSEILEQRIVRPMILTGLPRSGTSAQFNLLAKDPASRPLLLWETQFPDPMEGLEPGQTDPRRTAIEAYYAKGREKNPEFTKIHYTSADTPEECVLLQAYSCNGAQMGVEPLMEPYASWFQKQDLTAMYAYYHDLLRMLNWQRPGERWLLKTPAHMWAVDAMIQTFPDVCIVWSHRNPISCIASMCSMMAALMTERENYDQRELGPTVMEFYAVSLERGLAERARHDAARFVDVSHDEFVADSMGLVERIYSHFDLELSSDARSAMRDHIESNPKGKHGAHQYELDEYGLKAGQVETRFAEYIDRFEIRIA